MVEDSHRRPDRNRRAPEARVRDPSAPNIILITRRCYVDEWLPSCDAASALPSRAALPPQFFPLKTVDFVRGSTSNVGTPDAGGLTAIRLARCACHSHASRCWGPLWQL